MNEIRPLPIPLDRVASAPRKESASDRAANASAPVDSREQTARERRRNPDRRRGGARPRVMERRVTERRKPRINIEV